MAIKIGGKLGLFWDKEMAGTLDRLISASKFRSYITLGSFIALSYKD
jgi:hypothetical protein